MANRTNNTTTNNTKPAAQGKGKGNTKPAAQGKGKGNTKPAAPGVFAPVAKADATPADWVCRITLRLGDKRRVQNYIVADAARRAMQSAADADPAFTGSEPIYRQCKAAQLAALRGATETGAFVAMAKAAGWVLADCATQALPPVGVHLQKPRASVNFARVSADTVPVFLGTRDSDVKPGAVLSAKQAAELGYVVD